MHGASRAPARRADPDGALAEHQRPQPRCCLPALARALCGFGRLPSRSTTRRCSPRLSRRWRRQFAPAASPKSSRRASRRYLPPSPAPLRALCVRSTGPMGWAWEVTWAREVRQTLRQVLRIPCLWSGCATLRSSTSRAYLCSLPGVGRKTAACVLLFSYGLPDIPVDTHVSRVGTRLGLFRPGAPFEELHDEMLALTPAGQELEFHVNLLRHGRRTCHARKPACGECALARMCPSRRAVEGSTAKAITAYCSAAAAITSAWKISW